MNENPKVFISYSHQDTVYENKVLEFSNKLRSEGIDASIDLYEEAPSEGWPRWMENQIRKSDYVLVLCSKSYYEKFYSDEKGKGVTWEVSIIYQYLYDANVETKKFIPIFFEKGEEEFIPTPIKSFTYYNIGADEGYNNLYWKLRGVQKTVKPPLGKLRPLPEKERKTMFFSTPIDLEKWNKAQWRGMLYLFCPGNDHPPILGFLFHNYSVAKEIFQEWKENMKNGYADNFLRIDFIEPPFPKGCWVNNTKECNYGKGYFVHLGANIDEATQRGIKGGIKVDEMILATLSRYQWMYDSNNRKSFKQIIENGSDYEIMPIGIKDRLKPITQENLIIDSRMTIKMKSVYFTSAMDLNEKDICGCVLNKPTFF
ncbi:MAG: TIR domain-containing protein [Lactobacillus ruminis]|nr:TIR domain-containing protein [Ligilactobacillus ruminis]